MTVAHPSKTFLFYGLLGCESSCEKFVFYIGIFLEFSESGSGILNNFSVVLFVLMKKNYKDSKPIWLKPIKYFLKSSGNLGFSWLFKSKLYLD
jgi:hypothetical protein